jgi:hypothetical protein
MTKELRWNPIKDHRIRSLWIAVDPESPEDLVKLSYRENASSADAQVPQRRWQSNVPVAARA